MAKKAKKAPGSGDSALTEISRKFKAQPLLYIGSVLILVLVIIAFVGGDLLSGGLGMGTAEITFGHYDGIPISFVPGNRFSETVRRLQEQNRHMDPFDFQLWQHAFGMTVVHTAVLQEMNRSNYTVPRRTVDRHVAQLPMFQENGRFSPALFRQMPESRRNALWNEIHDELIIGLYFSDLFGLKVPQAEAEFIANMSSVMRSFDIVSFRIDDFPDSEYLAFAENNAERFGSIHLSRISLNNEREARRVLDSIINGVTTFEDAARSQSIDHFADRGGDMGIRSVIDLEFEIPSAATRQSILSLGAGELSSIVNIGTMWVFFRVEDELIPPDFENEIVMDRVRSHVRTFERGLMEDWAFAQAMDFINNAEADGFVEAAAALGLERHSFGPVPINFGSVDLFNSLESFSIPFISNWELSDMARNENFWRNAFATPVNTPAEPFVQGNNLLVFIPTELYETDQDRVQDIASMYTSFWLNNLTDQTLQTFFLNSPRMDNRFMETYMRIFW